MTTIRDEGACDHATTCRHCRDMAELHKQAIEGLENKLAYAQQVNDTLNAVERLHADYFKYLARLLCAAGCPFRYPDLEPIENVLAWLERRLLDGEPKPPPGGAGGRDMVMSHGRR